MKLGKTVVGVLDYGAGNLFGITRGLERAGATVEVVKTREGIEECDALVVPGVGRFGPAMREMRARNLERAILDAVSEKPFLGICLGMQILFEKSSESVGVRGLGVLEGECKKFRENKNLRVPQIGWNEVVKEKIKCPLLGDLPRGFFAYFVNSYFAEPGNEGVVAASTDYGIAFPSVVWDGKLVFGTQFHPEKSGEVGEGILGNFAEFSFRHSN
jgi:glutamine amidotransferase